MENTTKEMPKVEDVMNTKAPSPEGWQFKDDATITMHWKQYSIIMAALAPFEAPIAIMNTLKNQAINDGKLIPFYPEDVTERNEFGQVMKLRENFGKENKSNAVTLTDVNTTKN